MRSLETDDTYDVITDNSDCKEVSHLQIKCFILHGNITVNSVEHSTMSGVHKEQYCCCSNSHINVPSKHQQCAVCGKCVQNGIYTRRCTLV
jgi:hypothetical protein